MKNAWKKVKKETGKKAKRPMPHRVGPSGKCTEVTHGLVYRRIEWSETERENKSRDNKQSYLFLMFEFSDGTLSYWVETVFKQLQSLTVQSFHKSRKFSGFYRFAKSWWQRNLTICMREIVCTPQLSQLLACSFARLHTRTMPFPVEKQCNEMR